MWVEALAPLHPQILPPALGGAIRAARKQAVQNAEENRALQRKIMPARTGEALDDRAAARLLPQALEHQGGPDPSRRARRRLAVGDGANDDGLVGEARARPQQSLQLPALAQLFQATERGDDLLAHRPVLATVLDNLEIGATAGGLLSKKHGAEPRRRLISWPTQNRLSFQQSQAQYVITWHHAFAKAPPRCQSYQRSAPRTPVETVEDQSNRKTVDRTQKGTFD